MMMMMMMADVDWFNMAPHRSESGAIEMHDLCCIYSDTFGQRGQWLVTRKNRSC
jgi:hypothetical protein